MGNILYLEHGYSPPPARKGGELRTQRLLQSLRGPGSVYVLSTVLRREWEGRSDDGRVVWACIEPWRHPLYVFNRCLETVCNQVRWHPFGIGRAVAKAFPGVKFDAVVCRFAKMAGYAKPWKIAPVFIDVDDLPVESFRTIQKSRLGRAVGALADWGVRHWQSNVLRRSAGFWLSNREHLALLGDSKGVWLPNLPPPNPDGPCGVDRSRDSVLFVGDLEYAPNLEGMRRFLAGVWPGLHRRCPDVRCRIAGCGAPGEWGEIEGVEVLGRVDDLRSEYARCHFAVVPVYSGSGTCIKVLEALSMGRVALCSRFGARGVDASLVGNGVEVADSDEEMLRKGMDLVSRRKELEQTESGCATAVQAVCGESLFDNAVAQLMARAVREDAEP